MRLAETVTFGGSALNRAAELRGDADALARAARDRAAHAILLWRGKPLMHGGGPDQGLVRLPMDHPVLAEAEGAPVLLGLEGDAPVFAQDISSWQPPTGQEVPGDGFRDTTRQSHPGLPPEQVFTELRSVMSHLQPRDAELAATARALFGWHRTHRYCAICAAQSVPDQGGWQRVCPSCGAHHFPRTDPVVIMLITHGNSVLVGRSHGWPEGMYSLLAGFVEPGETIEAAVRREVMEEAGVEVGRVEYLASQPWPFPSSLMFGCRGEAQQTDLRIDPVELDDAMWVTREQMMEAFAGRHPVLAPARKGAIAHFILRNWLADKLD
ncbi:MAG: NAD(+) diphosphatase [Sediminimonas qiaohouensis]|uniref:NAD(+) diphosphatase n=1 Tax=Sediminimonas qiaohouensis TaxID=552061 RepID=A0A7C9L966_9RHOB|nr:NAD(+) diphosphatase [Sediminimonas qiaohouensis]MTJ05413.1 NAD(+) diphosphatase [Sediminimonas qiaohouensis]